MNDTTSESVPSVPRKKTKLLRWLAAAALLFVAWFCYQLFGPNPPIIVSKETTYITEPLRPDGLPDYPKFVRDKLREGVTPRNNAAVLMWQAFGPGRGDGAIDPAEWQLIAEELEILPAPEHSYLIEPAVELTSQIVGDWLYKNSPDWQPVAAADPSELSSTELSPLDLGFESISRAMSAPWRTADLSPLAEWVSANDATIDMLVAASRRNRFYTPFNTPAADHEASLLDTMSFHGIQQNRATARVLATRAMLHLGEDRHAEAWQDLLAIHRWARLIAQGPTIIEQLVAIAIDGIACHGDATLLASEDLPPAVARQIQQDLLALSPPADIAESFDHGERFYFLDAIIAYRRQGIGTFYAENFRFNIETGEPDDSAWTGRFLNPVSADWNVSLIEGNRWYDQLAAAARLPTFTERKREFARLGTEIPNRESLLQGPSNWIAAAISADQRNDMLATAVIAALSPAFYIILDAEDRGDIRLELTHLAAALAVYRADHGQYPERLKQLVPEVIPILPVDLYHAKPFIYEREADGYLLYSTGPNGIDDGGSNEQRGIVAGVHSYDTSEAEAEAAREKIPAGADDLSIRVPRPPFKLPMPPTDE